VASHDERFAHLDQLFESLGFEMESDTPELGTPVQTNIPSEPSDDWSDVSLDDLAPMADEPAGPTEDELIIDKMLAELDSPGEQSEAADFGDSGGDFLDLGGGAPDDGMGSSGEESLEDYTKNALADAPMWDDEPETPAPATQIEEDASSPEQDSSDGFLADAPADEFPGQDMASGFELPASVEEAPDETDFANDLDALLSGDEAAETGSGATAPAQDEDSFELSEMDTLASTGTEPGLDDEMSDFLAELESTDGTDLQAEPAFSGDDLDSLLDQEVNQAAQDGKQLESTLDAVDLSDSLQAGFNEGAGIDDLLSDGGLGDIGLEPPAAKDDGFEALPGMDDFGDFLPEETVQAVPSAPAPSVAASLDGFDDVDLGFGAGVAVPGQTDGRDYSDDSIDLSDDDIERVRKRLLVLTPRLRDAASRAIAEDRISSQAQNKLVRMLLNKALVDEVREFLEKETGEDLSEAIAASPIPDIDVDGFDEVVERPSRAVSSGSMLANAWPVLRVGILGVGVVILGMLLYLLLLKPGMTGNELMEKGLAALAKEEYVSAEDHFRQGETYLGKKIEWYRKYGDAYRKQKEYGRGIKKLRDGLAFAPRDFDTLMLLGDTYTDARDFDLARKTFQDLEKWYPESLKVPEKMGDLQIAIGDANKNPAHYEMARLEYKKILDADWKNLDGQFKTLRAYVRMRKLSQSSEKLKQIYNINEGAMHVPIMTEYAALLQEFAANPEGSSDRASGTNKWFESKTILGKVLQADWEHAPAHFYMSRYWRNQLDQSKALINLKHAVRIDRNNAVYHNETGEVLLELPKPEIAEATRSFTTARELDPEYPQPYINLGNIYFEHLTPGDSGDLNLEEQNYQQALENYENALRKMPDGSGEDRFYYSLGWLYYRKGRHEDAVNTWQKIYVENPFHPTVSFAMGNAWLHLKKDILAAAEYEKVLRYYETISRRIPAINPDIKRHQNVFGMLVNSHNNLGVAWELRHQRTGDAEWERKALMSFWKAREIADRLNRVGFEYPENNIRFILHRDVKRGMAIAPELAKGTIPKFLKYERQ